MKRNVTSFDYVDQNHQIISIKICSHEAALSAEEKGAECAEGRGVGRGRGHGGRRAHGAQVGAGARGAGAATQGARGGRAGGLQHAGARLRGDSQRGLQHGVDLPLARRAQVSLETGELLHGAAVDEAHVKRAGRLQRQRGRRRVVVGGGGEVLAAAGD